MTRTFRMSITAAVLWTAACNSNTFTPAARLDATPNTIALWNFDEGSGSLAFDRVNPGRQPARLDYGATWLDLN